MKDLNEYNTFFCIDLYNLFNINLSYVKCGLYKDQWTIFFGVVVNGIGKNKNAIIFLSSNYLMILSSIAKLLIATSI